ncbi:MAG: hypothetical protein MJ231_08080 [bacterium]|nr:hypothetical protein [bacterium]
MQYTKIRLDFKYGPKNRFYRVVLIKGNPDLFKLSVELGTAVGAMFGHCFLITCKRRGIHYVMAPFMEEPRDGYKYLRNYHLNDLPDSFDFEYDTGDGWDFSCKRYKKYVEIKSNKNLILLEGAGQGIWEDNIGSLYSYFNNEIDPDFDGEDEEKGIYKPWNVSIDKYSDFDNPLDIDEINDTLNDDFRFNYDEVLSGEKEYIEQNCVCLDDCTEPYNPRLKKAILEAVDEQINALDYVKKIFEKIKKVHGEGKAKESIAAVLITYIFDLETKHINFDDNEYKKRLTNIPLK